MGFNRYHCIRPRWYYEKQCADGYQRWSYHFHLVLSDWRRLHRTFRWSPQNYPLGVANFAAWFNWPLCVKRCVRQQYRGQHQSWCRYVSTTFFHSFELGAHWIRRVVMVWIYLGCFNFSNPILYSCKLSPVHSS